jgi:CPA1 family monovalent cation:H+ antiporter
VIVVLTAIFGYINFRFLRLPGTIGIMLISVLVSLLVILIGWIRPAVFVKVTDIVRSIDFNTALMKVMLGFLLFAGAIHIDIKQLKKESAAVISFSTIGMLISTGIVAGLLFIVTGWLGMPIDFIYCLLFGALISPTDPIAVMSILRKANIPKTLETKITGESLFNDGVAVVIFITIYEVIQTGYEQVSAAQIAWLFCREAIGGLLYGLLLGYIGFWALRSIDNYVIELLITLALVMGGYLLADRLHISGPLAMVVAGIVTGNKTLEEGTSDTTQDYIHKFWEMMDEVLNAILFVLMGFEMLIIPFNLNLFVLGCIAIGIVLFARLVSVAVPIAFLKFTRAAFEKNAIAILTWGGLRGGISVALALSLPASAFSGILVPVTYMIVLFSILVQGLTIGKVARKLNKA